MKKYPVLYAANETSFSSNGIGVLQDATRCRVTEELNGLFELELTYPANGALIDEIAERSIICAEASEDLGVQPFRVYRVVKSLTGSILIYARHISYDLSGIPVSPFHLGNDQEWSDVGTVTDAFAKIVQNSVITNPFTFSSTVTDEKEMDIQIPMSARSLLLGSDNSIVSIFGGEFKFDRFTVVHAARRGSNRGFAIRYGVNMTALNQDESVEPYYTGIYPYYSDNDGTIEIDGKVIMSPGEYEFNRIKVVDLTPEFTEAPWYPSEVEAKAREWLEKNGFGVPQISLDVGFAQLRKSEEYKNFRILETVNLGDDVKVFFEKIGVSSTARVTKTVWDALEHRYVSIHLGDASQSIATTISNLQKTSVPKSEASASISAAEGRAKRREAEIKELNDVISSGLGMNKIEVGGKTYYSDASDLNNATYIITMNSGGFAYTYDWNNGNPTWQGGLGRDGNLIINRLSALKIRTNQLETDAIQSSNYERTAGSAYSNDGSFFDLGIGQLITPNFSITRNQAGFWSAIAKNIEITDGGDISADSAEINDVRFKNTNQDDFLMKYIDASAETRTVNFSTSYFIHGNLIIVDVVADNPVPVDTSVRISVLYRNNNGLRIRQADVTIYADATRGSVTLNTGSPVTAVEGHGVVPSSIEYHTGPTANRGIGINASLIPLGSAGDLGKNVAGYIWRDLFIQNAPSVVSDRNEKNTIEELKDKYSAMFDLLRPVRFKMNNGTSDRFHTGMIAQDVEGAMDEAGVSSNDFAGLIKTENPKDGTVSYGLRYEEFIALCIDQIQKLKKRVEELEENQKGE